MNQEFKTIIFSSFTIFLGVYIIYYFDFNPLFYMIWVATLPAVLIIFRSTHTVAMFYRCSLPVLIGLLFILLYVEAHKIPFIKANFLTFPIDDFFGEQFYAVISTLYAIIMALVLVKGIESFDQLSSAVNDEANKIRSILEFLKYFEDGSNPEAKQTIINIRKIFNEYIGNVLSQTNASGNEENFLILRKCCDEVAKLDCKDENDKIALAEVMKGLNDLFAMRSKRINCAIAKIPTYLIFSLFVMSLSIIIPFFLHPPIPVSQNYTMIFLMATFGSFLLLMLLDINTPFDGFWRVDLREFSGLKQTLESDIAQDETAMNNTLQHPTAIVLETQPN